MSAAEDAADILAATQPARPTIAEEAGGRLSPTIAASLARDREIEAEFLSQDPGPRAKALRLWKFWGEGDEALRGLMERVQTEGVAGVTKDDFGKVAVAMMRAEGRRATAARAALKMLEGLVDGGREAALKAAKAALKAAETTAREFRERAERAEAAEARWSVKWEKELSEARIAERDKVRKEQDAAAATEAELKKRVSAGLADLGRGGPKAD